MLDSMPLVSFRHPQPHRHLNIPETCAAPGHACIHLYSNKNVAMTVRVELLWTLERPSIHSSRTRGPVQRLSSPKTWF
jgi:hypothetical protein